MADYNYEIFFDWNDKLQGLQIDRIAFPPSTPNGKLDNMGNKIYVNDSICFNCLNITNNATVKGYSIVDGSVTFSAASNTSGASSPFGSTTVLWINTNLGMAQGLGPCLSFPGTNYPYWAPLIPLTPITTAGNFKFTVMLQVRSGETTRQFRTDPEMVVGSTNPNPIYDQDQPAKPR